MSVRTCGLDLSERILDAGIYCGKKISIWTSLFIFYWIFVDFFSFFLVKIGIPMGQHELEERGLNMLDDDITIYVHYVVVVRSM